MRKRLLRHRLIYFLINIVFLISALCFINYTTLFNMHFTLWQWVLIIVLFAVIHFARFVRMYFILLEDLINPNRFLQLYVKTTFVSTLIPFKIGELYKMYCYGYETRSLMKGVLAVLIEKFFDAVVLCSIMMPYMIANGVMSPLLMILLCFIVLAAVLFFAFPGTYHYLNTFLISRGGGRNSLTALKMLEVMKKTYDGAKRTLRGRALILLIMSMLAWGGEALMIALMGVGRDFEIGAVFKYISDAFFGVTNVYFDYYASICAVIFALVMIVIYWKKYYKIIIGKEIKR